MRAGGRDVSIVGWIVSPAEGVGGNVSKREGGGIRSSAGGTVCVNGEDVGAGVGTVTGARVGCGVSPMVGWGVSEREGDGVRSSVGGTVCVNGGDVGAGVGAGARVGCGVSVHRQDSRLTVTTKGNRRGKETEEAHLTRETV